MKKIISLVGIIAMISLLVLGCSSNNASTAENNLSSATEQANAEVITLKMAYPQSPTHLIAVNGSQFFMDRVKELTNGKVEFVDYPSGQIGKAQDYLELIETGVIDIGYYASSYFPSRMPLTSGLGGLPGLYATAQQGSQALYDITLQEPILSTDFLNNGVRPLTIMTPPIYEIFSKDKLLVLPEDLHGYKVRGAGGTMDKALQSVGSSPTSIPAPDLYEAFERGTVDVLLFSYSSMSGYNLQEIANYGTRGVGFGSTPLGYMISDKVFQGLPEDVQEALVTAGKETMLSIATAMQEAEDFYSKDWEEKGFMEIYNLTAEEQEVWENALQGFDQEWAKEADSSGLLGSEALELYKEALKQYE